jgi:hypothetical protein
MASRLGVGNGASISLRFSPKMGFALLDLLSGARFATSRAEEPMWRFIQIIRSTHKHH